MLFASYRCSACKARTLHENRLWHQPRSLQQGRAEDLRHAAIIHKHVCFSTHAERTVALLAFEDAKQSPVGDLMDLSQRQKTASELNAAILSSQSQVCVKATNQMKAPAFNLLGLRICWSAGDPVHAIRRTLLYPSNCQGRLLVMQNVQPWPCLNSPIKHASAADCCGLGLSPSLTAP